MARRALVRALAGHLGLLALAAAGAAHAHGGAPAVPVPAEFTVAAPAPAGTVDLKFSELLRMPVGPRGLEPSEKLLALAGRPVRIVGYMANAEAPVPGRLILSALPVSLGDEDESLSDDLPANAIFVHLDASQAHRSVADLGGPMQLAGTLEVGPRDEADGRVSSIRLRLDAATSRRLADGADRSVRSARSAPHAHDTSTEDTPR